jgi:hypothetical protein
MQTNDILDERGIVLIFVEGFSILTVPFEKFTSGGIVDRFGTGGIKKT